MLGLTNQDLTECRELSDKVLGTGLDDAQRARWRSLTGSILTVLQNSSGADGGARRRFIRAVTALVVTVTSPPELKGLLTSNLGGGGFAILMADPPAVGTLLDFSIRVPQRQAPILVKVEVVWVRHTPASEIGVAFTNIDDRDRDLLEAIVVKHLLDSGFLGY